MNKKILVIIFLAIILRSFFLTQIPFRVDGDSSVGALAGISALEQKWPLIGTGPYGYSNVFYYIIGFFEKIFGENILSLRIFSALGGIFSVTTCYLLAKKLFNSSVAIYASFFLSISFFNLVMSRNGIDIIWVSFFASLILFLFLKQTYLTDFIAGLLLGFSQYFYIGARLIPILILLMIVSMLIFNKIKFTKALYSSLFLLSGFLIIYLPMILYFKNNSDVFLSRISQTGIAETGWLENEMKSRSLFAIFKDQIVNSYSVFWLSVQSGGRLWFFQTPYLEKWAIFFLSLGMINQIIFISYNYRNLFLLLYFFLGVFLAGVLTVNSPMPSRYIILFPMIAISIGFGMHLVNSWLRKKKLSFIFIPILIIAMVESLFSYWQHENVESFRYDNNTLIASYAGRYLSQKKEDYSIYFLGNEYLYYKAVPTLEFLSGKEGQDIPKPLTETNMKFNKNSVFIILLDRKDDLLNLQKNYPFGKTIEFKNPSNESLFYYFEI
ncbi:glycosyltransferase family 39 protein [Candidatus Roizmanbacteria bacterium]|nr:glycosyltransferase family 39 protein [Candidatus Roizmanbacteria bacterium]